MNAVYLYSSFGFILCITHISVLIAKTATDFNSSIKVMQYEMFYILLCIECNYILIIVLFKVFKYGI